MEKVSVLKCDSYNIEEVYAVIKKSLENISFEIPKNKKVLLKPNVLGQRKPETAVCTHPALIDALCKLLQENNNEIWIGDSSGVTSYGGTKKAFEISGIEEVAKKYNARLISFEGSERKEIKDDNAKVIKEFILAKEPFMADMIINIPKLKTHVLMRYTGAVKNMFGCVPGGGKSKKHSIAPNEDDFGQLLIDIFQNVIPQLSVMDAVIGMEGNGPGSAGTPKKIGLILASKNAVALDIEASRIIGYSPLDIKTTKYAIERGLFSGINDVEVVGEKNFNIDFKKPAKEVRIVSVLPSFLIKFIFKLTSPKPYVKKNKCKKCNICAQVCPVKAIHLDPYPIFDRKKCVLCYCCHENCPYSAIKLSKSSLIQKMEKLRNLFSKG